jgi:hypothetical protein
MRNNLANTAVERRAPHQQRPDITSFAAWIEHHLLLAADAATDLDLEVHLRADLKFHVRVSAVAGCLISGIRLAGCRGETPRPLLGPLAFDSSDVLLIERID